MFMMLWGIIIVLIVALDRVTKLLVVKNFAIGDSLMVINGFFYLTYTENKGAAMGILQNARYVLIALTILVSLFLLYYLNKAEDRMLKLVFSLILGGAGGNLIDRIFRGSVVDFLDFRFGSYHFYIFNIADTFVVIGTILLAYYLLFVYKEKGREKLL
ncbi:MAG: signal peptidase II [Clostridiales bacterium]|jgi:signal peptidase II|nr:signal peptidase II [Eubacteriales bacterium]MDH7565159.1 signal peptidase II [Clostridiales bacterium]